MGWYSGNRKEEVKQHIGPWDSVEGVRCGAIKHASASNEDWFLMEARSYDGKLVDTWISLMIWEGGMYKTMDEAAGPCYYKCPVEWLDKVPVPQSPYAADWREKVRALAAPGAKLVDLDRECMVGFQKLEALKRAGKASSDKGSEYMQTLYKLRDLTNRRVQSFESGQIEA